MRFHSVIMNMNILLPKTMIIILLHFLSLLCEINATSSNNVVRIFSDENVIKFNHLTVDKNTGNIYVGAVNRLYQLYPDLESAVAEITGPEVRSHLIIICESQIVTIMVEMFPLVT